MIDREITAAEFERLFFVEDESDFQIAETVGEIIRQVRTGGDAALYDLTERYDGVRLKRLRVEGAEIDEACRRTPEDLLAIFSEAIENVTAFHRNQKPRDWFIDRSCGSRLGQVFRPILRVGLYVPGGTASYPSSVIMNAVPAIVAGVPEIALISPPSRETGRVSSDTLAVAKILGLTEIYFIGGAQGVAALAYGTESVRAVCKITGPGNAYVTEAKRQVFGKVGIDSLAGPSELVVYCDETAEPDFLACDLIAQAEHDPRAVAVLISTSSGILRRTVAALTQRLAGLARRSIVERSLSSNGWCVLAESETQATDIINRIAPEHLEIVTEAPRAVLKKINNAGAVFLGSYSPTAAGDYWLGPNHVLPTGGAARYCSGLSVLDFVKASSVIECSPERLKCDAAKIARFAECEGLQSHADSVLIRTSGGISDGR